MSENHEDLQVRRLFTIPPHKLGVRPEKTDDCCHHRSNRDFLKPWQRHALRIGGAALLVSPFGIWSSVGPADFEQRLFTAAVCCLWGFGSLGISLAMIVISFLEE